MNTTHKGLGAAAALVLLTLGACAGSDDKSSSATDAPPSQAAPGDGQHSLSGSGEAAADTAAPSADAQQQPQPAGEVPTRVLTPDDRKLVIVMTIGVEVADAAAAVDKVIDLATTHGGQLYDSSLDLTDPATAAGDLVFKLPPGEVDGFLRGLESGIGRRTGLQGTTTEVTAQLTDLDAQILTARKSVERVRALLESAVNLGEVITLEGELSTRETHLEQLLAQQSSLNSQVAMATVTVHLTTAPPESETVTEPEKKDTGIGAAFRSGWKAFLSVLTAIALFVGYTAPFLLIGGLAGLVLWRVSRRRPRVATPEMSRSRSAAPPPPPAPGADPHTSTPDSEVAARSL